MDYPSCLTDPATVLVADASVIINLNATRYSEDILDALPNRVVVLEEVSLNSSVGGVKVKTTYTLCQL